MHDIKNLTTKNIFWFWMPLALVWLMMGIEQPGIAAVITRLPEIKHNLAAFGLTFALSLIIEGPIIQLLSAANVLARDKQSYTRLLHFTHISGWLLSLLHFIIAVTPIFDIIVTGIIGAPQEILELTRSTFLIMSPWTVAIAYRRLWQGILIGYGHTGIIPLTMISRLVAIILTLSIGYAFPVLSGANLGALALTNGVVAGAIVTWIFADLAAPVALLYSPGPDIHDRPGRPTGFIRRTGKNAPSPGIPGPVARAHGIYRPFPDALLFLSGSRDRAPVPQRCLCPTAPVYPDSGVHSHPWLLRCRNMADRAMGLVWLDIRSFRKSAGTHPFALDGPLAHPRVNRDYRMVPRDSGKPTAHHGHQSCGAGQRRGSDYGDAASAAHAA